MQTTLEIHGKSHRYIFYVYVSNGTHSPWVILNDFGGAFSMGAVGGGIWHGIKGARNSPRVCVLFYWAAFIHLFTSVLSPLS